MKRVSFVTLSKSKKKKSGHSIKGGMKGIGQVFHGMKKDAFKGYSKKKR